MNEIFEDLGRTQAYVPSMEKLGGYKTEVKERIDEREKLRSVKK